MGQDRINALRQALELTPDNHPLRQLLAESLEAAGQIAAALVEYNILIAANQLDKNKLLPVAELAVHVDDLDVASKCLDAALKAGLVEGVSRLRGQIDAKLAEQGYIRVVLPAGSAAPQPSTTSHLEHEAPITFAQVGGLEDVKKIIHKLIVLPLLRPELYRKYGRKPGGGILLYGPPGCGKTLLARATAGECGLPFFNVRIEAILDPYLGVSERNLHAVFEQARANTPCVLFLDELDALGFARRKHGSSAGRALVDQLLQEMDAIGSDNQELLILAATNAPWDLDDALLRPGRFDRRIFVPPPDQQAREWILQIMLAHIPKHSLKLTSLTQDAVLFSGADLKALVDLAVDMVIEDALTTGQEPPLAQHHLEKARQQLRPTTLDWLERAQNYVEFANQDKRYDDIAHYLKSREVRKGLS